MDWENVWIPAQRDGYFNAPRQLAAGILERSHEWARGRELAALAIAFPEDTVSEAAVADFEQLGFTVLTCGSGRDAADMELMARAAELSAFEEVTRFAFVSGDKRAFGKEQGPIIATLTRHGCETECWSLDDLVRMLELAPKPPPPQPMLKVLLHFQALADSGRNLWQASAAITDLGKRLGSRETAQLAWSQAETAGLFAFDPGEEFAQLSKHPLGDRRINYGDAEVERMLRLCDELLGALGRLGADARGTSIREVDVLLRHPALRAGEAAGVAEALIESGYLARGADGQSIELATTEAKLGILRRLRRLAAVAYELELSSRSGSGPVRREQVAGRWPYHLERNVGQLPWSERGSLVTAGVHAGRTATFCGAFSSPDRNLTVFRLRRSHPVVQATVAAFDEIVLALQLLFDAGDGSTASVADAKDAMSKLGRVAGMTATDRSEWLALLANERHVRIRDGRIEWRYSRRAGRDSRTAIVESVLARRVDGHGA